VSGVLLVSFLPTKKKHGKNYQVSNQTKSKYRRCSPYKASLASHAGRNMLIFQEENQKSTWNLKNQLAATLILA
jgi:hypothetical protein